MALTLSAWLSSAGAWLVPKIFSGDIKTHRLSRTVEENKHVIVKNTKTVEESAQRSLELIGNITES